MRPLNNNVLIKEVANGDETIDGIILPETLHRAYELGVVIVTHEADSLVKTGNLIAFHTNSGVKITVAGEQCQLIMEGNIMAVLQDDIMDGAG